MSERTSSGAKPPRGTSSGAKPQRSTSGSKSQTSSSGTKTRRSSGSKKDDYGFYGPHLPTLTKYKTNDGTMAWFEWEDLLFPTSYVATGSLMVTPLKDVDEDLRNDFKRLMYSILILIDKAASKGHTFIIFKDRSTAKKMADHLMPGFWDELLTIDWVKFRKMDSERRWPIMELNKLRFTDGFIAIHAVSDHWERTINTIHKFCDGLGERINEKIFCQEKIRAKLVSVGRDKLKQNPEGINELLMYYEKKTLGANLWPFEA